MARLPHGIKSEKLPSEKIDSVFKALDERLDTPVDQIRHLHESSEQLQEWLARLETSKTRDESPQAEHGGTTVETAPKSNSWPPIEDIQSEFAAIKDTLTKVKLRADLRLCDSRQGVRRSDQTTYNIFSCCARYAETSIKLLSITEGNLNRLDDYLVQQLFAILLLQIGYLQGEFSALVIQSQFDESTARIFRSLQKNTSVKNGDTIDRMQKWLPDKYSFV